MARGLFITGFTISEVLAIQSRAKECSIPRIEGWWKICTVPPKRVTVDAGREAQQNRADVERRKP